MSNVKQLEGVLSYVHKNGDVTEMYPESKTDTTLTKPGKAADCSIRTIAFDGAGYGVR